ncbi:FtsX-like permease family protein [Saccharothrix violaceirubra]|uniref:Multisubunit Na+/H+ antiporter MnhC subunit n=1 Tax=Saccharothrix violaceirubra TaxID=413306 RepID=A0A7W7SXC2_9PSEU|nr:ABC transporter permease [Saccharothrix violaceirubra]MBB4962710.1 multisubunit Na+/H+ antiporter MnhC subunit [Saccharothrix violaceirubra]
MPTRWVDDLVLGVRLSVGGGRTSWARLALTAVAIGLGVAVLLLAASIGPAREAKSLRVRDATPETAISSDLLARQVTVTWRGRVITGTEFAGQGTPPPGVARLPGPGEVLVSPELLDLMGDDSLRARFPERVVGVIGDVGLPRPKSLLFYAGLPESLRADARPVGGFGGAGVPATLLPAYRVLTIAAIGALLVPLGIFTLVATRLGASGRGRRLAAIRLVGATRAQARWIAGGGTLAGSVLGLLVGVALFFAARPLTRFIEVEGVGFFPTDLVPDPLVATLIAVGVPVTAVAASLAASRRLEVGPLGLDPTAEVPARRPWWRFALLGVGAALLVTISWVGTYSEALADPVVATGLALGVALVLAGTGAVLPWLVGVVARRFDPDRIAVMLALRGLRSDVGTPRVLAGVAVVLAGSLALQVLLGVAARITETTVPRDAPDRWVLGMSDHTPVRSLEEAVSLVGGVRRVSEVRSARTGSGFEVVSSDCVEIAERLGVSDCVPGAAYRTGVGLPDAGTRTTLDGKPWTVPPYRDLGGRVRGWGALTVATGTDPLLASLPPVRLVVRGSPEPAFGDRLLAATGRVDRAVEPDVAVEAGQVELFTSLRGGVIGGSVLLTLLAMIGLVAAAVDQAWEQRRPVAVLAANGVPRRVLVGARWWQSTIPAAAALALAVPVGLVTAWLIVPADRFHVDWADLATTVGAAAAVVLTASLTTLPALRTVTHPTTLRTE